jgi:hypothetical protein
MMLELNLLPSACPTTVMALAANRRASLPPRRPPAPALRSACLLHADADAKFSCPFLQPFDDLGIEENENWRTNQNESDEQEQTFTIMVIRSVGGSHIAQRTEC